MVGVFLAALDQTVVGTALPTDHHRPRRQRALHVGLHRLPADGHDQRPALRQALRPVRPPARVPVRHQRVHARLLLAGLTPGDVAAGRRARHPGPRRRRDLPARDGDHRRPLLAVRARPLPGPVRRRVRAVEPARPGHRRPDHRHDRLAVRVLRQHPDRPRGPVHDPALPAGLPPRRRQAEDRLPRRGAVHGRACADPHRADQQAVRGLDRPHGGRPDPAGRARPRRVRVDRVARGRADRAARAVPDPRVRGLGGLGVPGDVRVLRGGGVPAALVPGRRRLVRDGLGLPDAAAARRADRLGCGIGTARGPNRPLPAGWCSRR